MKKLFRGELILPDQVVAEGALLIEGDRILAADEAVKVGHSGDWQVSDHDGYISPGFIDLHVHGGDNADFMDATPDALMTVVHAHLRHGTTGIVPTTTVGDPETLLKVLALCRDEMSQRRCRGRVLGVHFYGPYFGKLAAGCHPTAGLRDPVAEEFKQYLAYRDVLVSATVAPELPGAEEFARACRGEGVVVNLGHSHCTFEQAKQAIGWGARHVDHLFCAMSDRARLRTTQTYPMRGGLMEATLYFDELTTEIIADGKHLAPELMMLAYKIKGPDRLALVTDCNRALDMPDDVYMFGSSSNGEPIRRQDDVGVTLAGDALASSVMGMDHMMRTFHRTTGVCLHETVRMASLTPARIIGVEQEVGSLAGGKYADFLLLSKTLEIKEVWASGARYTETAPSRMKSGG